MKVSKRGEYALRALIDFGLALELGRPLIQVSELASKERLPMPGLITFTRIFRAFKSVVHVRAKERTAALAAL